MIHQAAGVLELSLHGVDFISLFLNKSIHLLAQAITELSLFFIEFFLDLFGSFLVFLKRSLHRSVCLGNFVLHALDKSLGIREFLFRPVQLVIKVNDILVQFINLPLQFSLNILVLLDFAFMGLLHLFHGLYVLLFFLGHLLVEILV